MTLNTLKLIASRKLIVAAVAGVGFLPLTAQAHDRDRVDLSFGRGDIRFNLDIGHDRDRVPPPVVVEPVATERVWVDPVYQTVCDHVWVPDVTQDVVQRVWVGPTYEDRDVVTYTRHGREVVRQQVLVAPGHWEDQHQTVVVTPGHYEDVNRQVLVTPGHYEDRPVAVAPVVVAPVVVPAPPWRH